MIGIFWFGVAWSAVFTLLFAVFLYASIDMVRKNDPGFNAILAFWAIGVSFIGIFIPWVG